MSAPTKRPAFSDEHEINSKLSSIDAENIQLSSFVKWIDSKQFNLSQKVRISREGSCAQYGLVAAEDVCQGDLLFQIPRPMLLSPETCGISNILQNEKEALKGTSGWPPLLISLMYEYNNPASLWRPYLDLVPDYKQLDLPMFWPSSEVETLLAGTGVPDAVKKDMGSMKREFTEIVMPFLQRHRDKFSGVCENFDFYKRMVAFVMAYSFTEPPRQGGEGDEVNDGTDNSPPMMVPMADILNHVAKNNANLTFETDALKMVAVKDIKKGEEIYNTYGQLANWHLLHMYGFAERHPQNHYDTVDISIEDVKKAAAELHDGKVCEGATRFLAEMGFMGTSMSFVVGVDGVLTEDEMLEVLKVLAMTEAEFVEFSQNDGWEEDDDEDELSLIFDDIPKLKPTMKSLLKRSAELSLKRYDTSLYHDEQMLTKMDTQTMRQKFSLYTRYGQKQILHKLIAVCS